MTAHDFQVGKRYENRKGVYEVMRVDEPDMVIRWDTGEQITTPINVQAKILQNMERELAAATSGKRHFRAPKSFGELFVGLRDEDFSGDVVGTHWRAREQLGGAVTQLLNFEQPFNSWSIYKRPEVHWASMDRYGRLPAWLQTKFFARATTEGLHFGLYVERADNLTDDRRDWSNFLGWSGDRDNSVWLHQTMRASGAEVINPYEEADNQAFSGTIVALANGKFRWATKKSSEVEPTELSDLLQTLPENRWLNMVLGLRLSRDQAIAAGAGIAADIASFFNLLEPIYSSRRVHN